MMLQEDHESMGRQWYPHVNKIQQIWAALQSISAKLTCDEILGPTATLSLRAVLFGHPASSFTASPLRCGSGTEKKTGGARFPTAEENIAISCAAMTGKTWHECPSSARTTQLVAFVARMRGVAPIGRQRHSFRCASGAFGLEGWCQVNLQSENYKLVTGCFQVYNYFLIHVINVIFDPCLQLWFATVSVALKPPTIQRWFGIILSKRSVACPFASLYCNQFYNVLPQHM